MAIAERLYIRGFISYPRTETTHYADSFDLKGALQPLSKVEKEKEREREKEKERERKRERD